MGHTNVACGPLSPIVSEKRTSSPTRNLSNLPRLYAIAVEGDLSAVSRCDEPVIAIGVQGRNNAVGWHVVSLNLALLFAHEVLQLAARGLERITDRHVGVLVGAGYVGIAVDDDVGGARHGGVNADPVGVSLVMAMLGTPDDDAR